MRALKRLFLLSAMLLAGASMAADEISVSIEDFSFLTGYWRGAGFGGISEEMWTPATDGGMFGVFKQSSESGLLFSELMEIVSIDGVFQLRLKHFDADFSAWEEKNEHESFKLLSVAPSKAVFDGLSYELTGTNQLKITLSVQQSDGSVTSEVFDLDRIGL